MTIQQLIDKLQELPDKSLEVYSLFRTSTKAVYKVQRIELANSLDENKTTPIILLGD